MERLELLESLVMSTEHQVWSSMRRMASWVASISAQQRALASSCETLLALEL